MTIEEPKELHGFKVPACKDITGQNSSASNKEVILENIPAHIPFGGALKEERHVQHKDDAVQASLLPPLVKPCPLGSACKGWLVRSAPVL